MDTVAVPGMPTVRWGQGPGPRATKCGQLVVSCLMLQLMFFFVALATLAVKGFASHIHS